jgi:2-polyprenyl-6-methoxyphenol hydroxylase-like FAD-dependent oxidoreductase
MGLSTSLERAGYRVRELRFVDREGSRAGGFGADVFRHLTGGRYISLPRSALARLIYDATASRATAIFDDSIVSLLEDESGINVTFARSAPRRFDLVIGADGLHSNVRRLVFGGQERFERYLGYVVAAFETTGYRPRDENVYVSYSTPGRQAARFALRDDRTLFLFVFAKDHAPSFASHDTRSQKALVRARFRDAGWECPRILVAMDRCDDIYCDG